MGDKDIDIHDSCKRKRLNKILHIAKKRKERTATERDEKRSFYSLETDLSHRMAILADVIKLG
jgi:hypothetical protein